MPRCALSSYDCEGISRTLLPLAEQALGTSFLQARKIVDNRNSVGFRLADSRGEYLLKINKNPASREVRDAAVRMNTIATTYTGSAFSVPYAHYIDKDFDVALMDFVPGIRLDMLLGQERDPAQVAALVAKAAEALSAIHNLPAEDPPADGQGELSRLVQDVADAFPAFYARNRAKLEQMPAQVPIGPVALHGDFSPKNLILHKDGTLFAIDFSDRADSPSPLRDVSVFVIGMARTLNLARRLLPARPGLEVEPLVQHFLDSYVAGSAQIAVDPAALTRQLALFELVRLVETKIWLDGYRAFEETALGWLKAMLGRHFTVMQLRRLQGRFE